MPFTLIISRSEELGLRKKKKKGKVGCLGSKDCYYYYFFNGLKIWSYNSYTHTRIQRNSNSNNSSNTTIREALLPLC